MEIVLEGHRSWAAIILILNEHFPHIVGIKGSAVMDPIRWCEENIGVGGRYLDEAPDGTERLSINTEAPWCRTNMTFGFKDPVHASAFRIVFG